MDACSIAGHVFSLAQVIYEQVQTTRANQHRCKRLGERIKQIADSVRDLSELPDTERYRETLAALLAVMKECHAFVVELTGRHWFRQAVFARLNKEKLDEFTERLAELLPQLNVGLTADMLIKREDELADAAADRELILSNQEEIKRLNQAMFEELQRDMLTAEQLSLILGRQMGALQASLLWGMRAMIAEAVSPIVGGGESKGEADDREPIDEAILAEYHELVFLEEIGKGAFGKIYRGMYREQPVAIKAIDGELTDEDHARYVREVKIMSRLQSPYITQFYAASVHASRACVVMAYMQKSDLHTLIGKELLSPDQKMAMSLQLAKGLQYLHHQHIVHAAIKPQNVLINNDYEAKWTNFGLSRIAAADVRTYEGEAAGLLAYRAPETYEGRKHLTPASDVYGLGMLLWFLWTGKEPFTGKGTIEIMELVTSGERESFSDAVPLAMQALIQQCWAAEPLSRPSVANVVRAITAAGPTPKKIYLAGLESERLENYDDARHHYERAKAKGYVRAFTQLAGLYMRGLGGIEQNKLMAYRLLVQAALAKRPHARAMFNLAEMLCYGDGVVQDKPRSLWWYQRYLQQVGRACPKAKNHNKNNVIYLK